MLLRIGSPLCVRREQRMKHWQKTPFCKLFRGGRMSVVRHWRFQLRNRKFTAIPQICSQSSDDNDAKDDRNGENVTQPQE